MTDSTLLHQEIRWKGLSLHYDEPSYFVNAQWRGIQHHVFVIYRALVAVYYIASLIWTGVKEGLLEQQGNHLWIYLTNWVLLILVIHTSMSAFATFYHHMVRAKYKRFSEGIERDVDFPMSVSTEPITLNAEAGDVEVEVITDVQIYTPIHLRISWLTYEIALTNSLNLVLLYWLFIYDHQFTDIKFNNNFCVTILLFVDVFITKVPVRLLHGLYSVLFFLIYLAFNVIYCKTANYFPHQGHRYIYRVLNWEDPLFPATGVTVIVIFLYPASHVFWFTMYQLRLYLWRKYGQG